MAHPNPINARISPDSNYQLSCVANGSSHQRVTVTQNGKTIATFSGTGEGTQMKQQDGATTLSGSTKPATQFTLLFQHSTNGSNGPFQNSTVILDSTAGIVTTIATEDAPKIRNNDTVLTLVVTTVAAASAGH
jgi:hypothetical protein